MHLSLPPKSTREWRLEGGKALIVTISTLVKLRLSHVSDTDSFSPVYAFPLPFSPACFVRERCFSYFFCAIALDFNGEGGGESLSRACAGVLHSPEICASQADFLP